MLGAKYKEGQTLLGASDSIKATITLPEDDPKTLEIILRVLHYRDFATSADRSEPAAEHCDGCKQIFMGSCTRLCFLLLAEGQRVDQTFQASCDMLAAAYLTGFTSRHSTKSPRDLSRTVP